jgi:hypothetical protein
MIITASRTSETANYIFLGNFAPSKVKFFAWLLFKARIQSRTALLWKNILSAAEG